MAQLEGVLTRTFVTVEKTVSLGLPSARSMIVRQENFIETS